MAMESASDLLRVSKQYITFIGRLVSPASTEERIREEEDQLFNVNVVKIVNGAELLRGREALHIQLMQAREHATPGEILDGSGVDAHIPTAEVKYSTTIRFKWETLKIANGAPHIVIARLVFDEEYKITLLDEVFSQCGIILHDKVSSTHEDLATHDKPLGVDKSE